MEPNELPSSELIPACHWQAARLACHRTKLMELGEAWGRHLEASLAKRIEQEQPVGTR